MAVQLIRCPLCSYEYAPAGDACQLGCPLAKHCHWLCCPHCGYRMVDEAHSRVSNWLQRLWPVNRTRAADAMPAQDRPLSLADVPTGVDVEIAGFLDAAPQHMARFAVLGLIPGATARILQRHPAPLVQVDETELALSADLLAKIRVQALP